MTRQVLAYGIHHIRKSFVPKVLERATLTGVKVVRPTTPSVRICLQHDAHEAAHRAGPSTTAADTDTTYDTRCYFDVRSKADVSQLNLPHGTDN